MPIIQHSFQSDAVGITKPSANNQSLFPSCVGYQSIKKKYTGSQPILNNDRNIDTTRTTCSCSVFDEWRVLKFVKRVGYGKECYKRVQKAAFNWDFEARVGRKSMGIVSVSTKLINTQSMDVQWQSHSTVPCTKPRRSLLATFTEICLPLKSVFVVNPIHVVYEMRDARKIPKCIYSSTSYATLRGHLLAGEERVSIVWRKGIDNAVDVEIVS